ncbi:carboxymuconolactone decarboxylase family protein [Ramlibacter sp.]|uniref:carboxymuconolactone decarboxylase family protein n=1 Tax=Ramlibacter sp. TaxID=1917967 RepID=UPI003D1339D3
MSKKLNAEVARAKEHFTSLLGTLPEPIRAMADYAPEALVAYLAFKDYLYHPQDGKGLDLKSKQLVYVVLDTATGNLAGAKNHLRAAMDAGLTIPELAQALIQVMNVCGITTWGQTGYLVMDEAARLVREKHEKSNPPAKAAKTGRTARRQTK